jgi:exonuclease SbcC
MRPVKLTMSAFGSYAKETTIAFDRLEEGLFLITGNTGSGKTLIFDAIMFALYNDTSGMTRGHDKLRSDFADSDVETFVELEFLLRGETYKIKRSPSYARPKQRGQGMTTRAAEVELTYPDGRAVTMVRAVEEEVKELLGLDKSQFRQVAMIAQGEFYELIGTSSNDRSEIFRRLFDTGLYERIQTLFAEKWRDAKNERERCEDKLFHELGGLQLPDDEEDAANRRNEILESRSLWVIEDFSSELKRLGKEMDTTLRKHNRERADAQAKLRRREIALEKIRRDNETIDEYEKALAMREKLEATEEAYRDLKQRLDDDERAARVVDPAWNAWQIAEKAVADVREKVEQSTEALKKATTEKEEASERLMKAKERDQERQKLPLEINSLNEELGILKSITPIEEASKKSDIALKELETAYQQHLKRGETLEKTIEDVITEMDALADAEKEWHAAQTRFRDVESDVAKATAMRKTLSELRRDTENMLDDRKRFNDLHLAWKQASQEAQTATEMLFHERAGYLASSLKDGEPCPVCGSTEHPMKATLPEKALDEATVERLRKDADEKREQFDRASSALEKGMAAAKSTLDHFSSEIDVLTEKAERQSGQSFDSKVPVQHVESDDELGAIEAKLNIFDERVLTVNTYLSSERALADQAVQSAKGRVDRRAELANELKTQRDALSDNKTKLGALQEEREKRRLEQAELQVRLKELKERVSGRAFDEVQEEFLNKSRVLEELNEEFKGATDAERNASEQFSAAKAAHQSNQASLKNAEETCVDREKDFREALEEAKFVTENDYREKRLRTDEREALRKQVDEEERARQVNKHDLERLSVEVKDLEKQDLEAEKAAVDAMREAQVKLDADYTDETLRVSQFNNRTAEIEKLLGDAIALAKEESMLGDISKLASGQHREADKISFETFVQTWYFSQVIARANLRYSTMTNGRYKLRRSEGGVDQRSRTGLDLSVEDLWTTKERPVSTLSGGEKFQAALALALGLSDVISEHAGGVEIDALFVDEGFGGLDDDSLQDVIEINLLFEKHRDKSRRVTGAHTAAFKD